MPAPFSFASAPRYDYRFYGSPEPTLVIPPQRPRRAQGPAIPLGDFARVTKRAEDFFKLENLHWTADMMDQIERELRVFVLYDRDPEGDERGLTEDSSLLGSVHTRIASLVPTLAHAPAPTTEAHVVPPPAPPALPPEEPAQPVMLLRKRTRKDK